MDPNLTAIIIATIGLLGAIVSGIVTVMTYKKASATHLLVNGHVDEFKSTLKTGLEQKEKDNVLLTAEIARLNAESIIRAEAKASLTPAPPAPVVLADVSPAATRTLAAATKPPEVKQ